MATERDFYKFIKPFGSSALWELKITKTGSLPFSSLKEHQNSTLLRKNAIYKFPDTGVNQPGCDGFWITNAQTAWVIVLFYVPRKSKVFYYIEIEDWKNEQRSSRRKSLTEERAKEIARYRLTV